MSWLSNFGGIVWNYVDTQKHWVITQVLFESKMSGLWQQEIRTLKTLNRVVAVNCWLFFLCLWQRLLISTIPLVYKKISTPKSPFIQLSLHWFTYRFGSSLGKNNNSFGIWPTFVTGKKPYVCCKIYYREQATQVLLWMLRSL